MVLILGLSTVNLQILGLHLWIIAIEDFLMYGLSVQSKFQGFGMIFPEFTPI